MTTNLAQHFRKQLDEIHAALVALSPLVADTPWREGGWTRKQIVGHLLDSAANNHQRIVRAQFEDNLSLPGYDQNRWVAVHAYQRRDWKELIEVWQALNQQLLAAAEAVPDSAWSHTLTVAGSEPLTLQFVFDDYVVHMLHHLQHIGIEVDDIKSKASNAA